MGEASFSEMYPTFCNASIVARREEESRTAAYHDAVVVMAENIPNEQIASALKTLLTRGPQPFCADHDEDHDHEHDERRHAAMKLLIDTGLATITMTRRGPMVAATPIGYDVYDIYVSWKTIEEETTADKHKEGDI